MEHQQNNGNEKDDDLDKKSEESTSELSKRYLAAQADIMALEAESKSIYFTLRKTLFGV